MKATAYLFVFGIGILSLTQSCKTKAKESSENSVFKIDNQLKAIESLEKKINPNLPIDKKLAQDLVVEYTKFVDSFPSHIKSPDVLMKLSDLYYGQREFKYQTQTLRRIIENYPDYAKIDVCYYMLAHILDSEFDERAEAKKFYNGLIDKYPRSAFSSDAKVRLGTIDSLSYAQLIEAITSQAGKETP